jgi:hypothetical protein
LLLYSLYCRIGQAAAAREDTTKVGCVIKHALFKGRKIKIILVVRRW